MIRIVACVLVGCSVGIAADSEAEPSAEGFRDPPRKFSQVPLWSWNGRLEPDELRRQIDQMVDKGVYGAFMHARAGINLDTTPYFSEGWWRGIDACVEHGAKVGFATWLYDEDKWPSGAAGGRTIKANPQRNCRKGLKRVERRVTGPKEVRIDIPDARCVIAGRLAAKRSLVPGSLVDISSHNSDKGKPTWRCPDGEWLVIGFVPQTKPDEVNYLNARTVRDFMDITHEAYARRVGKHFGTTIPGVFYDEIHNSGMQIVWCEGFAERFRQIKGYDLIRLLPALSHDVGKQTPKVRCDYYDVYTTLYEEAWFKQLADWCAAHKLELTGHTVEDLGGYRTQGSYFRTIRHKQIPGTDNEDFRYTWPRKIGSWKPKQLASISHLYGWERAGVEAMGGAGWAFNLNMARYGFNMLAAYGINFYMSHLFHYAQDKPANVDDWPNSWFFRNPYWKYFKTFADHGSRLSYMLTGGTHVADVAVFYPITNLWAGNKGGTATATVAALVAGQIDCDVVDPDSLARATVADRCLSIGQQRYRVLIVPGVRCMRRDAAVKIREFIAGGGIVIVHDRWPTDSMEAGRDDPQIARLREEGAAKGIEPSSLKDTVRRIGALIARDVVVQGKDAADLRYHHVRRGGKEIYWLANDAEERRTWRVGFRVAGAPSLWDPEDGVVRPITLFEDGGGRMTCDVALDGWQGQFVVFDTTVASMSSGGVRIDKTNLIEPRAIEVGRKHVRFAGLLAPGEGVARVEGVWGGSVPIAGSTRPQTAPSAVDLSGSWRFLPVGDVLDDAWRIDAVESELALPVMWVRWERGCDGRELGWHRASLDDSRWRQIKVFDALHPRDGADRYRSRWEGRFISFYDYSRFHTKIGGKSLRCRKRIMVPAGVKDGWLAVVCESPFRLTVGDRAQKGKGGAPQRFDLGRLPAGEVVLTIIADDARAILAEGCLTPKAGRPIPIFTDSTWTTSTDGRRWQPAWEYVAPPEKPFGEPAHPADAAAPTVVWYRQPLPRGTVSMASPKIEGDWQAWANGQALTFANGVAPIGPDEDGQVLTIRVDVRGGGHGLLEPVRLRIMPVPQSPRSWTEEGLAWYSGRAIYSTTFELTEAHLRDDVRLRLDLGKVCYCAEIWLNGHLVGTRVWPPYAMDIKKGVRVGENRLDVVVANLLANRMRWDIYDDVKGAEWNRKWHDGNIRRDAWCLESGLIGPARIVPLREVAVTASARR